MEVPQINLALYHEKACTALAEKFAADIDGAFAYKTFSDTVPKSISIELDGVNPGEPFDTGTEQFHAELRFAAYVVVPFKASDTEDPVDAKLIARQIAMRLIGFLHGTRFGCPGAGPARVLSGNPDDFNLPGKSGRAGGTDEYEVWRVEWTFEAYVGESVWIDDGSTPTPVEVWTATDGEEVRIA